MNNSKRRYIALGLENPDGTLVNGMTAVQTLSGFSMSPQGEVKERDLVRSSYSKVPNVIGAKDWQITLPLELKGGGLVSNALQQPPLHDAFLACGFVQLPGCLIQLSGLTGSPKLGAAVTNTSQSSASVGTLITVRGDQAYIALTGSQPSIGDELAIDAATATVAAVAEALVYKPVTDRAQHKTLTLHAHLDGQRRIATRCTGSFSFEWMAGDYCKVSFSLKGNYAEPTNETFPSASYNDLIPPIAQSAGLQLADYPDTGTIEKLSVDMGIETTAVPDINSPDGRHSFRISDRKVSGSVNPEVVALGDYNPFADWANGNVANISATIGQAAGEMITLVLPATRVESIGDGERAGSDAYDLSFSATGQYDDEIFLIFH